jgi:hypothetical protein
MLRARLLQACCMFTGLAVWPCAGAAPGGGWEVAFDSALSNLSLRHAATGTVISGRVAFTAVRNGSSEELRIQAARDDRPQRLVLADRDNEVQGYLTVLVEGDRVSLAAVPRPPFLFGGELIYKAEGTFGTQAFACRTRPSGGAVVQMASGPADSLLNDSLFDPQRDLVLRFAAYSLAITTQLSEAGRPPLFQARLQAAFSAVGFSTIALELVPDYYRGRYVPEYHLIDRGRTPVAPTGWMSWNTYFDTATEQDNLDNARIAAQKLLPYGLKIWEIESWQANSPRLPVSNFHNLTLQPSPEKFPHGMKWLAGELRALGFRPGIWTVPWGTGDEQFYREHRDWFLHDAKGQPFRNWSGRYMLDPSQWEVRRHMEETHRIMSSDWGYEVFKIDGLEQEVHLLERAAERAALREPGVDSYRLSMEALRRGIGPASVMMACQGSYTGPDVTVADATRIGFDLVVFPDPPNWHSYVTQAKVTLAQLFTNNLIWYNDPDTLKVGQPATLEEARIATTVVALPGQLTFLSDKLGELPAERMRLLQQALPASDVHPLDLWPIPDLKPVWDLKIRRPFASWDVVSVFNWEDAAQDYRLPMAGLGLDPQKVYVVYEFWSRQLLGVQRGDVQLRVAPRSNLLLAVHEVQGRPQFVSTDRHISQGGAELAGLTWTEASTELEGQLELAGNDPLTFTVYVPEDYKLANTSVDGATVERVTTDGRVLSVVLRGAAGGKATLRLKFAQAALHR